MATLATGVAHTLVISDRGHLYSFGSSEHGELGRNRCGGNFQIPGRIVGAKENDGEEHFFMKKKIVHVASGDHHCAAISIDGCVYTWGNNTCKLFNF